MVLSSQGPSNGDVGIYIPSMLKGGDGLRINPKLNYPHITRRLDTIPLPPSLKMEVANLFAKWWTSSGQDWTLSRMKEFRDCLLKTYSNPDNPVRPTWFATTRSGNLRGPFGQLWKRGMSSHEEMQAVLSLLSIMSVLKHNPHQVDYRQIGRNITQAPGAAKIDPPMRKKMYKVFTSYFRNLGFGAGCNMENGIPLLQVMPGKQLHQKQLPWDIHYLMKGYFGQKYRKLLESTLGACCALEYDATYDPVLDFEQGYFPEHVTYIGTPDMTKMVGYIHVSNEPGCKDRYFAAPNLVIQRALDPLKWMLQRVVKQLPWDCTHDQRKADDVIIQAQREGKTIHSVDLSKATDNFPWNYQKLVLHAITNTAKRNPRSKRNRRFLDFYTDIIENGNWTLETPGRTYAGVKWNKGQPLGSGPSFFLFTLAHGMLLYHLNGGKWNSDFFVVGDDVVILNDNLASLYKRQLELWSVPISELKSFDSPRVAQFAGCTYIDGHSFWIPKWVPFTRDNLLDCAAWWYPGLTKGMPDHPWIERVLSLPKPWGLGRNPKGIPLGVRFPDECIWEWMDQRDRRTLVAKPSATHISKGRLRIAADSIDEDFLYEVFFSLEEIHNLDLLYSTRVGKQIVTSEQLLRLMDETEVPGYPSSPVKTGDPYSLGALSSWKRVLSKSSS